MPEIPKNVELNEAVGGFGIYQVIVILVAFHQTSFIGSLGSFVQFLVPNVIMQWQNANHTLNTTVFHSTHCEFADIWNEKRGLEINNISANLVYKAEFAKVTLTEELNLICERSWLVSLSKSAAPLGFLFGNLLFGIISERFGRRWISLIAFLPTIAAKMCILFNSNYVMYAMGCFLYGASLPCISQGSYVTMLELLSIKMRPWFSCFTTFAFFLGQCSNVVFAWTFDNWFYMQLSNTVFFASSLLISWYVLESPLWLVVRGRKEEAEKVLRTIVRRNLRKEEDYDPQITQWIATAQKRSILSKTTGEGKLPDLFKRRTIRKYVLSLTWMMFSAACAYHSFTGNMESFGSSLLLDTVIANCTSVVFCIIFTLTQSKTTVRLYNTAATCFTVVICVLYPVVYAYPVGRTVLSGLARGCLALILGTVFSYSAEVIPTSVRGLGLGLFRLATGLAGSISPFTRELGEKTMQYVPVLLLGAMLLPNAILLLKVLPETKGNPLMQTVEELEKSQQTINQTSSETEPSQEVKR